MKQCANCGALLEGNECLYCKSVIEDPVINSINDNVSRGYDCYHSWSTGIPITDRSRYTEQGDDKHK